jgi:hypothetical protein
MLYKLVNKDTLEIVGEVWLNEPPIEQEEEQVQVLIEVPEGLDHTTCKAELLEDEIVLVPDAELVAQKKAFFDAEKIKGLHAALNTEVYTEMARIYETTNPDSATAYHETWKLMVEYPEDYLVVTGMPDEASVIAFASAKLAEVKAYAVWRIQKINEFMVAKAAILNG